MFFDYSNVYLNHRERERERYNTKKHFKKVVRLKERLYLFTMFRRQLCQDVFL